MQWNASRLTLLVLLLCFHNIYSFILTVKGGTTRVILNQILKINRNGLRLQFSPIKTLNLTKKIILRKQQCLTYTQFQDCLGSIENRCTEEYVDAVDNTIHELSSGFARFRLLQRYLTGEILYEEMQIAVAFVLGYRLSVKDSITCSSTAESNRIEQWLRQDQKLSPVGWEDLSMVPRLDELGSVAVQCRLERDLPADAASTDTIMETLVGGAQYAYMRNNRDDAVQRRILIAKWLCVQGFLTNDFPVTERYVPVHIQKELEREMED